jgi:non-ribosomal peptide synthetase component E (peptide arylation enzyme)
MTGLLQQGMTAQAHRRGAATAVVHLQHRLTYHQLDQASTQLAMAGGMDTPSWPSLVCAQAIEQVST